MERLTFEGLFCDIAQCAGEPGNTSECPGGYCDQRRTWERLKEYEDKIDRGELAEVVRCKDCKHSSEDGGYDSIEQMKTHLNCRRSHRGFIGCVVVPKEGFCNYGERKGNG